jgi:hypothetical protein
MLVWRSNPAIMAEGRVGIPQKIRHHFSSGFYLFVRIFTTTSVIVTNCA